MTAPAREAALAASVRWLDRGDREARWIAQVSTEGGYSIQRVWRGVTDHHPIEPGFLASAEARKLARVAGEHADVYAVPAQLARTSGAAPEPSPRR